MRRIISSLAVLLGFAVSAQAASIPLLSGSQYSEPSQVLGTVNTVIQSVNANVGANGAGTVGSGLIINSTTSAINALSITPGATTVAPILSVGDSLGQVSDTNIGIVLAGKGTGKACIAGSTCANSSGEFVNTTSAVNHLVITGAATGVRPSLVVGGTGADTNIGMVIAGAGTGPVLIGGATTTLAGLQVAQTASAVNDLLVTNGATGTSAAISANTAGADTNAGITLTVKGSGIVTLGAITTCSGTTTATCQGQRFTASVTGLSTAAGGTSATAMTVTDASVVSSASLVICNVNGYSGTGQPIITNVTPGTGTVSFQVTNIAASGSLNATVPAACVVL